jgi:hypothetical protein
LSSVARDGALAYLETNYFGGTGSQAAAVFAGGSTIQQFTVPVTRDPVRAGDRSTAP